MHYSPLTGHTTEESESDFNESHRCWLHRMILVSIPECTIDHSHMTHIKASPKRALPFRCLGNFRSTTKFSTESQITDISLNVFPFASFKNGTYFFPRNTFRVSIDFRLRPAVFPHLSIHPLRVASFVTFAPTLVNAMLILFIWWCCCIAPRKSLYFLPMIFLPFFWKSPRVHVG